MASKKKQIASLLAPNKTTRRSSNPVYAKLPGEEEDIRNQNEINHITLHKSYSKKSGLLGVKRGNKELTKSPEVAEAKRGNKGVTKAPEVAEAKKGNKGVTKSPEVAEAKRGNKGVTKAPEVAEAKRGNKGVTKSSEVTEAKKGNKGVTKPSVDEMAAHNSFIIRSKTGLIGLEYRIVLALCDRCKAGVYVTEALKINEIAIALGSNRATIKQSLLRLRRKGFIQIAEHKNGRGGWIKFKVEKSVFQNLKEIA